MRCKVFSNRDCASFALRALSSSASKDRQNPALVLYPRSDLNNNKVGFTEVSVELVQKRSFHGRLPTVCVISLHAAPRSRGTFLYRRPPPGTLVPVASIGLFDWSWAA